MTLIEVYLKKQFPKINEDIIKELSHYLTDNGYKPDLDKMEYILTDHLYLSNENGIASILTQETIEDDDNVFSTIVLLENGRINNPNSYFHNYKTIKHTVIYLTKPEIQINYNVYPNNSLLEGTCSNVFFSKDEFSGYILYPKYDDLLLDNPYLNGIDILKKRHLLLSFMGEISDKSIYTYYQKFFNPIEKTK